MYKLVDTCAAEFEAFTPYYYSTYETELFAVVKACEELKVFFVNSFCFEN